MEQLLDYYELDDAEDIVEELAAAKSKIKDLDDRIGCAINDEVKYDLMEIKRGLLKQKDSCEAKLEMSKSLIIAEVSPTLKEQAKKLVNSGKFSSMSDLVGIALSRFLKETADNRASPSKNSQPIVVEDIIE